MNFSKISIHSKTKGTIIMTPKNFYKTSDNNVYYVVIYNLKFINSNPEIPEIEAKIPYYISNGKTNKLRANMLYPFLCYSSMNEVMNCPYDITRSININSNVFVGVLIKYSINSNINIDQLEQDLLNAFLGIYPHLDDENSRLKARISEKTNRRVDLISVLERITNLVDFLICIIHEVICDFDYTSQQTDIDNGKYRPLSASQIVRAVDYTDMSVFGEETTYINPSMMDDSSSPFNNHFRLVILTILNRYYKLFVDNNIIDIETIILEPEIITVEMFNIIANICDKETAKLNMNNYKMISNEIIDIINEKIDITHTISEKDRLILKSIIIQTEKTQVFGDEIYNKLLAKWNLNCLSKGVSINTTNTTTMDFQEICRELDTYSEFIRRSLPDLANNIYRLCNDEKFEKNADLRLKKLRYALLKVRREFILLNYIGQLKIKIKYDKTEKTIIVPVDTSETITTLKFKIFDIEGIDPTRQRIMFYPDYISTLTELENDRTIASYKILNDSILLLYIN